VGTAKAFRQNLREVENPTKVGVCKGTRPYGTKSVRTPIILRKDYVSIGFQALVQEGPQRVHYGPQQHCYRARQHALLA
jgi:hypothetical protein